MWFSHSDHPYDYKYQGDDDNDELPSLRSDAVFPLRPRGFIQLVFFTVWSEKIVEES